MTVSVSYVTWVKRIDGHTLTDEVLRKRAGVEDSNVDVRTESLDKWGIAVIPSGSRDEWGSVLSGTINVGYSQLSPEGRVYLVSPG